MTRLQKLELPNVPDSKCSKMDVKTVDEIFFSDPSDRDKFREAKLICGSCDSASKCLAYALSHPELEGIWAGTSKRMRERMRTSMRRSNALQ